MPIIAVRLILENKDKNMLFLRQTKRNGGKFSLIGGTVEEHEFAKDALCREVYEEVGIRVDQEHLRLVLTIHRNKLKKAESVLVLYFKTDKYYGIPSSLEPHKFKKVAWLDPNKLPENLSDSTSYAIGLLVAAEVYGEYPSKKKSRAYWDAEEHYPEMF